MPTIICPNCKYENKQDATFCEQCGGRITVAQNNPPSGAPPFSSTPGQSLGSVTIPSVKLPIEVLIVLILIFVQAILNFIAAYDFSNISIGTFDGFFSLSPTFLFVLVGLIDLVVLFGVYRKFGWGTIVAGTLALVDLAVTPGQTVVSVLLILVLLYYNRAVLLSRLETTAKVR